MESNTVANAVQALYRGERIEVNVANRVITGTVDCVAADASIFWIWQDAGAGRVAVLTEETTRISGIGCDLAQEP